LGGLDALAGADIANGKGDDVAGFDADDPVF
jgi:hypothetical protein